MRARWGRQLTEWDSTIVNKFFPCIEYRKVEKKENNYFKLSCIYAYSQLFVHCSFKKPKKKTCLHLDLNKKIGKRLPLYNYYMDCVSGISKK